jgi:predicted metal-dependent hydrolase
LSKHPELPEKLAFPALGELWHVEYQATETTGTVQARLRPQGACVRLSGDIANKRLCYAALQRFVIRRAREALPALAAELAGQCEGILERRPSAVSVMNARRRWGSCSVDGRIRLNCKLLFLPAEQAKQVILHELAHLRVMNHSRDFYTLLHSLPGSSKQAEKANRKAMTCIPNWFLQA